MGWQARHEQRYLGNVINADHRFLIGNRIAGVASLGQDVTGMQATTGDTVLTTF